MTDPIEEYEAGLKKLETKKAAAINAYKEKLKDQQDAVNETERKLAGLTGMAPTQEPKKARKKSTRVLTPEHKAAMAEGRKRKAAEKKAAAGTAK
jgi:hypothetical protein